MTQQNAVCLICHDRIFETNELLSKMEGHIIWSHRTVLWCDDPTPMTVEVNGTTHIVRADYYPTYADDGSVEDVSAIIGNATEEEKIILKAFLFAARFAENVGIMHEQAYDHVLTEAEKNSNDPVPTYDYVRSNVGVVYVEDNKIIFERR
jgi:hypothetical protein